MSANKPLLTIGLPVYNGENFIREAIDSILSQSFKDFELIICDNCSTDATEQICRDYAAQDPRVRYVRNEENIGAAANYNKTFELSSTKYFKWAAHDDVLAPGYLEKCIDVLESDPGLVLCAPRTKLINDDGSPTRWDPDVGQFVDNYGGRHGVPDPHRRMGSPKPYIRLGDYAVLTKNTFEIFGVMRSDALAKTKLFRHHFSADKAILGELIMEGRFAEVPEELFLRRCHPSQATLQSAKEREEWQSPSAKAAAEKAAAEKAAAEKAAAQQKKKKKSASRVFLYGRYNLRAYVSAVARSRYSLLDKALCYLALTRFALQWGTYRKFLVPGPYNYFGIDRPQRARRSLQP